MTKYVFGVDIGGTTCKLGLFDEDGNMLEKWEINTKNEQLPFSGMLSAPLSMSILFRT